MNTTETPLDSKRIVSVDFFRGLAILGVVLTHCLIYGVFYSTANALATVPIGLLAVLSPIVLISPMAGLFAFISVTANTFTALRRFELALLGHLGYGVNFTHCAGSGEPVDDTMTYRYREEKGFIASVVIDNKTFTGRQLKALNAREFPDADTLRAAKRFTRMALKPYLGGKPLKSRELFRQFMPKRTVKTHYE